MIRPVYRFAAFVAIAGFLVSPAATASAATIKFDLNGVAPVVHTEQHSNAATVPTIELDFDNMTFRGGETLAPPATVGHIRLVTLSVRTSPCTPNGLTGHNYPGDRRQRVLYSALSRIGARYDSDRNNIPNVFVCDGLTAWAYTHATGEVWSREDKLDLKTRSIITVTSLISKGITDSSLVAHMNTAKTNGVTKDEMAELITHVAFYAGWPNAWAAFRIAKEVYND